MKMVVPRLFTITLVAVLAVLGSIAGRAIWESVIAQDQPTTDYPSEQVINDEVAKPRFVGEVLGIFIGPEAQVPDKFVTGEEICGSQLSEQVTWDKAGEYDLQVNLPEPFRLDTGSLNTGVIACGDTVYAARWDYSATQPNGYPGGLIIARSVFKYDEFDVSAERVVTAEIAGLPVVYIKPLSASGVGSAAGVIFPGEPVTTSIRSTGVPETDLLRIAEIVADRLKAAD